MLPRIHSGSSVVPEYRVLASKQRTWEWQKLWSLANIQSLLPELPICSFIQSDGVPRVMVKDRKQKSVGLLGSFAKAGTWVPWKSVLFLTCPSCFLPLCMETLWPTDASRLFSEEALENGSHMLPATQRSLVAWCAHTTSSSFSAPSHQSHPK